MAGVFEFKEYRKYLYYGLQISLVKCHVPYSVKSTFTEKYCSSLNVKKVVKNMFHSAQIKIKLRRNQIINSGKMFNAKRLHTLK